MESQFSARHCRRLRKRFFEIAKQNFEQFCGPQVKKLKGSSQPGAEGESLSAHVLTKNEMTIDECDQSKVMNLVSVSSKSHVQKIIPSHKDNHSSIIPLQIENF